MNIVIGGDVVSGDGAVHNEEGFCALVSSIERLVEKDDLLCVNLEGAISPSTDYRLPKIGPATSNTLEIVNKLNSKRNLMVCLANNHIMDFGKKGLEETCKLLKDSHVRIIGAQVSEAEQFTYDIQNVNGLKVAHIAFAEEEFNRDSSSGACIANYRNAFLLITALKIKVDKIVAQYHGGIEFTQTPTPSQRDFSKFLIDLGCDVVVGHHSHCIGSVEKYKDKYIFYSVGNLYFPKLKTDSFWRKGLLLRLNFDDEFDVSIKVSEVSFDKENGHADSTNWISLDDWLKGNRQLIVDDDSYDEKWEILCAKHHARYSLLGSVPVVFRGIFRASLFLKIRSYYFGNTNRLLKLNMLRCSSHRDILTRVLKREK